MTRQFNIGRSSEMLMNEEQYDIFRSLKFLNDIPNSSAVGPTPNISEGEEIKNGAVWLDNMSNESNADLKFFKNGAWNLMFNDRFKITGHLLDEEEPMGPIESQLWIDSDGILKYYDKGEFRPVKATMADIGDVNPLGFEDFIIINQVDQAGETVVDNFTSYLFAETPIIEWSQESSYVKNQGAIYRNRIYVCRKDHASSSNINVTNLTYWIKLEFLNQFLVPDASVIKMFIDGHFIHQDMNMTINENGQMVPDPNEEGWKKESNVCVSFPIEMIEGRHPNAVHVNPTRLHNVRKKFIAIDKGNPIIEVPEEHTEFYGMKGGVGRLLLKRNNVARTDYISVTSNNIDCIKLSPTTANDFDFIYTITYTFPDSKVKEKGILYKKKFKLKDENYIWIDIVDADRIIVFAQGLLYEKDPDNYRYDEATGYLYIAEDLQDYENMVKSFDFSVLYFPKVHQGKINAVQYDTSNYYSEYGYRVSLGSIPKDGELLAFLRGVQMHVGSDEVIYREEDPTAVYFPSLTREFVENTGEAYWCVAETNEYDINDNIMHSFYRGKIRAVADKQKGIIIPISRNKDNVAPNSAYLAQGEMPIMFIDGVLVFQKETRINEDYLTIYGLKEGQEVVVLGDTNSTNEEIDVDGDELEFNSDRVLFEDSVSYATIPTEFNDCAIVYLKNGVLSDATSVTTSVMPIEEASHGEVRHYTNYTIDKWMIFNGVVGKWEEIPGNLMVPDANGKDMPYVDLLDRTSRGYTATRNSISFLQNLGEEYCTYYAYKYSDSIEKKLLLGYVYPNSRDGVNIPDPEKGDPTQFKTSFKHYYSPGKNELTVYLNGVRQNLLSPNDIGFLQSKNRECRPDKNNEFVLAWDNKTERGAPILEEEGYYVYHLRKDYRDVKSLILLVAMTDAEKIKWEAEGYKVELVSEPLQNRIFYVIERCEGEEPKACERKILTYKDAFSEKGAYASNTYDTAGLILTRGNIRVYVNGLRQPYGAFQTKESMEDHVRGMRQAYRIIDSQTIQFEDPLIGGLGGNEGTSGDPKFPIGNIILPDGTTERRYYEELDEIVIEVRRDFKIREASVPILDNTGVFGLEDGIPLDLFKTKDRVLIWINGFAYGREYKIENETIRLMNDEVRQYLGMNKTDVVTFEWR